MLCCSRGAARARELMARIHHGLSSWRGTKRNPENNTTTVKQINRFRFFRKSLKNMRNTPAVLLAALLLPSSAFCSPLHSRSSGVGVSAQLRSNSNDIPETHRSNSTHMMWRTEQQVQDTQKGVAVKAEYSYQTFAGAVNDCVDYLRRNIMPFDLPNLETLGFPPECSSTDTAHMDTQEQRSLSESGESLSLPDGLSDGVVNRTVHLALQTKQDYPWTDRLPREIFYEYVLSFAASNEARTNWRPLLTDAVKPIIDNLVEDHNGDMESVTVEELVKTINQQIWTVLGKAPDKPIHFVSGQTPLIFDPMSVIVFGYASCTGMSILFAFALRSAGIPARLVGTPAWHGDKEGGNHNWVEVWTPLNITEGDDVMGTRNKSDHGGMWRFLESGNDWLDRDPCERWFCDKKGMDGKTKVYAARYDRDASAGEIYPLAWDENNKDVPGVDRSDWYTDICNKC